MVWRKHDFVREVHRQLVEIAAIRKRAGESPEVLERLDRLELSHVSLIGKLLEYFQHAEEAALPQGPVAPPGKEDSAETLGPDGVVDAPRAADRVDLWKFHDAVEEHVRGLLERISGDVAARATQATTALQRSCAPRDDGKRLPRMDQRCAACHKVLLSGVLGGEDVVQIGESWYHARCIDNDTRLGKPELLN